MNFTSMGFILFLCITIAIYFLIPQKMRQYALLVSSLIFYAFFGKKAVIFILLSAVSIFLAAKQLNKKQRNKVVETKYIMGAAICFNLLLLIALKYTPFLTQKFSFSVPLGISFYTLSAIGYLMDVYRGKYPAEKNFLKFLLYISFFPHIIQGPIARYDQLAPQLSAEHSFDFERLKMGSQLMLWGYLKKFVIANQAALFVDAVYADVPGSSGTLLFVAAILYTIQIYADFSGYMDIAMGTANIMGIDLIQNFRQPYLATSINDFWKRWHISLSSWFRDYVYIPLGGNRKGVFRRWVNVVIVFLVSGFWHGVGFTFIVWGGIHAAYQIAGYLLRNFWKRCASILGEAEKDFKVFRVFITFLLVNFAWVYFRADTIGMANEIIRKIFTDYAPWTLFDGTLYNFGISEKAWSILLLFVLLLFLVDILHEKGVKLRVWMGNQFLLVRWFLYIMLIVSILVFGVYGSEYNASSFIYMNF